MKKLLLTAILLTAFSCAKKETVTITQPAFDNTQNEQRLTALESALRLNSNNDVLLEARVTALEILVDQEIAARQAGDDTLAAEISALRTELNAQITSVSNDLRSYVNTQISTLSSNTASLTARIDALESLNNTVNNLSVLVNTLQMDLDAFKVLANSVYATIDMLDVVEGTVSALQSRVVTLEGQIVQLSSNVVSLVKAPCSNSREVLIKMGQTYYADINTSSLLSVVGIQVLGSMSSYLGELMPGQTYTTNDGRNCRFSVVNGQLVQR